MEWEPTTTRIVATKGARTRVVWLTKEEFIYRQNTKLYIRYKSKDYRSRQYYLLLLEHLEGKPLIIHTTTITTPIEEEYNIDTSSGNE